MDSSCDLMQLLAQMKEEHERNTAAIEALDRQAAAGKSALSEQREQIGRMEAEVEDIYQKNLQSAGSARQVSEVLGAERIESAALESETARLDAELAASTAELEALQQASSEAALETYDSLTVDQRLWRKRCRAGYSNVLALACSLAVLEVETTTDSCPKRACASGGDSSPASVMSPRAEDSVWAPSPAAAVC